jgi:hypothetical protein
MIRLGVVGPELNELSWLIKNVLKCVPLVRDHNDSLHHFLVTENVVFVGIRYRATTEAELNGAGEEEVLDPQKLVLVEVPRGTGTASLVNSRVVYVAG